MAAPKAARKSRLNHFQIWFTLGLSASLAFANFMGYFSSLENRWEDTMFTHRGMRRADPHITLITIDDSSINEIGTYPWPRHVYAPLIDNLVKYRAKVIGLDILFIDPTRPQEDDALAKSIRAAGNVVLAVDEDPTSKVLNRYEFDKPIPQFRDAAKGLGMVTMPFLDPDGAVRQAQLMFGTNRGDFSPAAVLADSDRLPSLGLAMLALFQDKKADAYVRDVGNAIQLNVCGERDWEEPVPGALLNGQEILRSRSEYGIARISAIDVIKDRLTAEQRDRLKGGIALVGSSAIGAFDHYPTPFSSASPGMEVHANVIDNLLQGNYLRNAGDLSDAAATAALPVLAVFLIGLSPLLGSLTVVALILGWLGLNYGLFLRDIRVAGVAPAMGLGANYFVLLVQRVLHEQREKRYIKNAFGQYLSPKVVNIIAANPSMLKLGGEKRDMSVFFLDIAHFTTISEKMTPEALTHFLNKYLTAFTNIILKNDGVVDKYIGDCIMAFWNAPLDQPIHRELACLTALECLEAIQRLNKELIGGEMPEQPAVRIGLNSGEAVVGNMGSDTRLSYTVIGDTVNLASRLEGANKFFGSHLMASEDVFDPVKDKFEARQLGRVRVVGKAIPIRVYELWSQKGKLSPERKRLLDTFDEGQRLYFDRRFSEAAALFKQAEALDGEDKVVQIYLSASQDYVLVPPPADWDGVFNLTSK